MCSISSLVMLRKSIIACLLHADVIHLVQDRPDNVIPCSFLPQGIRVHLASDALLLLLCLLSLADYMPIVDLKDIAALGS